MTDKFNIPGITKYGGLVVPPRALEMMEKGQRKLGDMNYSPNSPYSSQNTSSLRWTFPRFVNPMMSYTMFFLPPDRKTLFQWLRFFDTFHPIIGPAIDTHVLLPLSRFALTGVNDEKIMDYYENMVEDLDLFLLIVSMARDYWLLGESYSYLHWGVNQGRWAACAQVMPELIRVEGSPLFIDNQSNEEPFKYYLDPKELQKFLLGDPMQEELADPLIQQIQKQLPKELLDAIQADEFIEIDNFNIMSFTRKQSGYQKRGTSVLMRVFRQLILETRLMESWYAIADRLINPKAFWKVGSDTYPPTKRRMENLANMIQAADGLAMFTMITDHTVEYSLIGSQAELPDLKGQFDHVKEDIMSALFMTEGLMTGKESNFATASMSARLLLMRYIPIRQMIERQTMNKIFTPVAVANDFFEITQAELNHKIRRSKKDRNIIMPEFDWRHKADLLDSESMREFIKNGVEKNWLPVKSYIEAAGEDPDYVEQALEEQEGTIFDPLYQEMRKAQNTAANKPESKTSAQLPFTFKAARLAQTIKDLESKEKVVSSLRGDYHGKATGVRALRNYIKETNEIEKQTKLEF